MPSFGCGFLPFLVWPQNSSPVLLPFAIEEMIRCTRPGGVVFIVDNVWPGNSFFRPIAWLTRKLDRGKWVRTEKDLLQLVNDIRKESCRHKRITYTYTSLELLMIKIKKCKACNEVI